MEGVVVVGIAPVERARRDIALLVSGGDVSDCLDHGLFDSRIVEMRPPIGSDNAHSVIGSEKIREHLIAVGWAIGGWLQAQGIDATHALAAQLLLHRLE